MRKLLTALVAFGLFVTPTFASLVDESLGRYAGRITIDAMTGETTYSEGTFRIAGDVYNNTNPAAPANFGFSSTDMLSTFGDRVTTTGTGILQEADFTVFNAGTSAGSLLTATYNIRYFDGPSGLALPGVGFTTNVNFGAGLGVGFFSIVTVTNLAALNININTTDVTWTQQRTASTGAANRIGIASLNPPTIGTSIPQMYIQSATVGGGVAGFYNIGTAPNFLPANPGARINVPEPTTMALLGLGALALIRRRR
jgi:PEP-CTERM motif